MDFAIVRSRFSPFGLVLKTPDKGYQAALDFDFGRSGPERLGVQVSQDQARLGAEREAQLDPPVGFLVTSHPCFDTQRNVALLPLSNPYLIPGIAVWHAGLAEHGVLEGDLL